VDEEDPILGVDRDDRDRPGVADDVPRGARAIGPLDRVDAECQIAALMNDLRIDDPLDEVVVGRAGIDRGFGVARADIAGPGLAMGQAATASRSEVRLAPDSASNRWSLL
jgi:hypothetical protein